MRLDKLSVAFACVVAAAVVALPASAQQSTTRQRVDSNRDHTVYTSRDENGRTRTKIIVQKRSYLDPGTEPLPSEHNTLDYVQIPGQQADYTQKNTSAYSDRGRMFDPFDLPSAHNPFLQY